MTAEDRKSPEKTDPADDTGSDDRTDRTDRKAPKPDETDAPEAEAPEAEAPKYAPQRPRMLDFGKALPRDEAPSKSH